MKSWQINLLNLNALLSNELKKDKTYKNNINCLQNPAAARKDSTFDSSFNSVQSLNANLPYLAPACVSQQGIAKQYKGFISPGSRSGNGSNLNYNKIISYKFNSNLYSDFFAAAAKLQLQSKLKKTNDCLGKGTITNNNNTIAQLLPKVSIGSSYLGSPLGITVPPIPKLPTTKLQLQKCSKIAGSLISSLPSSNIQIKDTYKLLFYLFKSMYCLISKPVLKYTNDKVTIQLFYYLNIPKKKVFRLFSILYIDSIKKKWFASLKKSNNKLVASVRSQGRSSLVSAAVAHPEDPQLDTNQYQHPKIYLRWKLRKAISRLLVAEASCKNQNIAVASAQAKGTNLLFNLRKFNLTKVFQTKFKLICDILSNKFNKPVELELTRLHHPYHDSNILVNLLSLNIKNKRKKARVAIQKIYSKKPVRNQILNDPNFIAAAPQLQVNSYIEDITIPTFLSGLNIKIAGRLMGEPIIPRITTKVFEKGATASGKVNYLDVARITKKNKKGAYTIKITSGQNFL